MSYAGARSVNRVLLRSAQNMGASRAEILRRVVIPATAPFVFAVSRRGAGGDDRGGDHRDGGSADGLGYLVIYSLSSLRTDRMLAVVVVIAPRLRARQGGRARARPVDILGKTRNLLRLRRSEIMKSKVVLSLVLLFGANALRRTLL